MTKKKTEPLDFEKALAELERLVEQMEQGEQPLEQALAQFEHGIELARSCQTALADAEQRVELLLQKNDRIEEVPLSLSSDPAE